MRLGQEIQAVPRPPGLTQSDARTRGRAALRQRSLTRRLTRRAVTRSDDNTGTPTRSLDAAPARGLARGPGVIVQANSAAVVVDRMR